MEYQAKNEAARPQVERGMSVAHRTKDSKQARAAKAANICDGLAVYQPTQRELAWLYDVSVSLINRAQQLPPEHRKRVAAGVQNLPRPAHRLALSKPKGNGTSADEQTLFNMIATVGVEKTLAVAAAVEQAQHH